MSFDPQQNLEKTAFGELSVAENTPVVQLLTQYGQLSAVEQLTLGGGTSGSLQSVFFAQTAAATPSIGAIISERALTYKPGQGAKARFTAKFNTPAANNEQDAGLLGFNDTLTIGYDGLTFGIWHRSFAQQEVQVLTITTPAAGAENATVTVDGVGYTVALTAGTVNLNAYEIATSLNTQVPFWSFDSDAATVTAVQDLVSTPVGAFAFASATAVAAWVQTIAAVEWAVNFIPQSSWSETINFTINPQKLTPYEISFEYLGGGGIEFKAENPTTTDFEVIHKIMFAGTSDIPSLKNPTFRIGWAAENKGNTSIIKVEGASAAGFLEGKKRIVTGSRATSNIQTGVGATLTNILTLRCRKEFGSIRNLAEVIVAIAGTATDATKPVTVDLIRNAVPATFFDFSNFDTAESVVQTATNSITVSGGQTVATGDPGNLDLSILNQVLIPGDTLTVAMSVTVSTAEMKASVTWFEDQ